MEIEKNEEDTCNFRVRTQGRNSDTLCDEFIRGAKEAGRSVEKVRLAEVKLGYCTGCYACQKLHRCVQKDDGNAIVEKMLAADSIVLATPVYFYSMNAQLKTLIDRTVSRWDDFGRFNGMEFWLIVTAADGSRKMMHSTLEAIRGFMRDCMNGSVERGVIYGTGVYELGAVKSMPVMQNAYKAGLEA